MIKAYVDGACSGNGKKNAKAGWAYILLDENDNILEEKSGSIKNGTNNIGELTAIIEAIKAYYKLKIKDSITIYSDSAYCINGITNWRYNWKKNDWWRDSRQTQELKNRKIWIELDSLIDTSFINFQKIPGHSGEKYNEYVDKKAVKEAKSDT